MLTVKVTRKWHGIKYKKTYILPIFLFLSPHLCQKHCVPHCTARWGITVETTVHVFASGTHLPVELTLISLFSDIWNNIKHWPFLNPQSVPLASYCFFSPFSLVPSEWFMVIYSRLSAAGHKPNPAGSGDQNGNPRAQTESWELQCQCLLQSHNSTTIKAKSYCALGKWRLCAPSI